MALTAAERAKRHRDKLKNDPEQFNEHKKKHAALVKSKTKKVSELTEKEKELKRKKWREQKRKQNENKKKDKKINNITLSMKQINQRKRKNKQNQLTKKYKEALKRIQVLTTSLQTTKKKLYRLNIRSLKKIRDLETRVDKMKAREEVLECALKHGYKNCENNNQKRVYKCLIENESVKKAKKKTYVAKLLGLKGRIRIVKKKVKNNEISEKIERFFLRDDITRCTAGKRECRTLNKKKEQIRYLTDTLINLYKIYKLEGGKYSLATFYKYKPFYVLSPTIQNRNTCLCVKHENFEMLFRALVKNGVLPNCKSVTDLLTKVSCDILSYQCMHGECNICNQKIPEYDLKDDLINLQTQWIQWERKDHIYKTNENGAEKTVKTKITARVTKKGTIRTLVKCLEDSITPFKKHYYTWKHQQEKYKQCVQELKEYEALILCDFSENYTCKLAEEIQSMHFGASKHQITLHTGIVYFADKAQSFCSISDNNCHQPAAIWAHLIPVIKMIREMKPGVNVTHVYSDGPSSQYRQKKNFYLLNLFASKLKLDYATWSFTESGHGKGVADGIGGKAKRILDQQVSYGRDVANGTEAYEVLKKCMPSTKCFYIADSEIANVNKLIPKDLDTIIGTLKIHQIIWTTKDTIQHRTHACFCGVKRGLCDCFSPKTHTFDKKNTKTSKSIRKSPATRSVKSIATRSVTVDVELHANGTEKSYTSCKNHNLTKSSEYKNADYSDIINVECETYAPPVVSGNSHEKPDSIITTVQAEIHAPPVHFENGNDMKPNVVTVNDDHKIHALSITSKIFCNDEIIEINDDCFETEVEKMYEIIDDVEIHAPTVDFENVNALPIVPEKNNKDEVFEIDVNNFFEIVADDPSESCLLKDNTPQIINNPLKNIENICTKKRSIANSNENIYKSKKKKKIYLPKSKNEDTKNVTKATKSLKTIVSRTLECDRCKKRFPMATCMTKCISCHKWICLDCSGNSNDFDYICDTCFGE